MRALALGGIAFGLVACCGTAPRPTLSANVEIDAAFTSSERTSIEDALSDWAEASQGGFTLESVRVVDSPPENTFDSPHLLRIVKADLTAQGDGCGRTQGGSTPEGQKMGVYIQLDRRAECAPYLAQGARHEVGHALGLGHNFTFEPSVMHVVCSTDALTVQPADVAAFKESRP